MSEHVDVVIVGAGISGISAAWHLQDRCPSKSYAILESRANLGGTWDLFKYPGIRSDSDMFTLGFRFRPWTGEQAIADGPSIQEYLADTATEFGIDRHIRYHHKVVSANWSTSDHRWTLDVDNDGTERTISCSFLFVCSGYYHYEEPFCPEFPGQGDFTGTIVHPQHWPQDLDYQGKNIVVIGSGATSVTLVPALANSGAGHVTMLQRSPTYILSQPEQDAIANRLKQLLPAKAAYAATRWKNIALQSAVYQTCQRFPQRMRKLLLKTVQRQLPDGYDVERHFGPSYDPWDQRLCLVPNGDLFRSIRHGQADVVTDTIDRFSATGIKLASGTELPADIIVTATGLNIQMFGGATVTIDDQLVDIPNLMSYKAMMFSGLPNLVYTFGYTNIGWTLKADLTSEFGCRLIDYMDEHGYDAVTPQHPGDAVDAQPFLGDFRPGYVMRALDQLPKQGSVKPWRLNMNYLRDLGLIRHGKIADEGLRFSKTEAAVTTASA